MRFFNYILSILSIICLFFVIKSGDDFLLYQNWSIFEQFHVGNAIVFNLASGMLISIIFYFIVVLAPEMRREKRIKSNFYFQYFELRRNLVYHILGNCQEAYNPELYDTLIKPVSFREYFKETINNSYEQTRWDVFYNNLDQTVINNLQLEFEVFKESVSYLLNNLEVTDKEAFSWLHQFNAIAITLKGVNVDDESRKVLARYLWEFLACYNSATGNNDVDIFEKIIRKI